ncbi:AMP-binding protein [Dactylosporangium sp. CA-233914]|uniref:class I adenylate-forming enzyme family protein n=1 Tax=Dactylosporangium sp. CA-233914 TaxID=3239934 RepID=UPI003D8F0528
MPGLLAARAAADPHQIALLLDGGAEGPREELTFERWLQRAERVAVWLRDHGVRTGDRIGLVFPSGGWLAYAVAYCGVLRAGAVAVPLGGHLGPATVAAMLDRAQVTGTVYYAEAPGPGTPGWRCTIEEVEAFPAPPQGDVPAVHAGDLAQILYTSGTTGVPKGVLASHANLTHGLDPSGRRRLLAHSRHSVHAFALGTNAAQAMLVQALVCAPTTVIVPRFDADSFAAAIARHRAGSVFVVPSMAAELVAANVWRYHDLSSVRLLGSTAAALPAAVARALVEHLPDVTVTNCYTSTEAAPAQLTLVFDPERPTAVGRADRPDALRVTDDNGSSVARGRVGQVWLRGVSASRTYLDDDDGSAGGFSGGWVAMGDYGYLDDDGYLHLIDRAADVVKSGGLTASTLRVEAALFEHPAIAEAAVVGVPHPILGQVLAAAVVPASGQPPVSDAQLRAFLTERLDRHEVPSVIERVPALPHNAGGKVSKESLRPRLSLGVRKGGPVPATETEQELGALWSQLLRTGAVGRSDDFFALGGDSLRAAQLAAQATEAFGLPVPSALAFDHPDLAGQAAWIDAVRAASLDTVRSEPVPATPGALSSLQLELLRWMDQTTPARDVGPMYVCVDVEDELDPDLLCAGLAALVHRHEALRTRCVRGAGDAWHALVLPELAPELVVLDAAHRGEGDRLLAQELIRPFAWRTGPLVRAVVIRLAPQRQLFALVAHHLVVDGWSFGILLHELGEVYTAARAGAAPVLPEPAQAGEVVGWHRARWPQERRWWRTALSGAPGAVDELPGRRAVARYAAASVEVGLDTELNTGLRGAAMTHRTTTFVVAAAGWLAVLARHSGAAELVVLTPVTGRTLPRFESAVGCLTQSLLIRVTVGDNPSFATLIARLRDGLLVATDHQAYPLAEFTEAVPYPVEIPFSRWSGHTHLPGLVSRGLALPHGLVWRWRLPGPDQGVPKLELAEHRDRRLTGRLTYNRHAVDRQLARRLGDAFCTVLRAAVHHPAARPADLLDETRFR